NGKPLRPAIDAGFKRAFTAIRDSNCCTLITCLILGWLGTPEVKGFALTLGIGVLLSLFTAITVTRTFLYLLVDAGIGNNPALFGLKRQWGLSQQAGYTGIRGENTTGPSPVNVIGKRRIFYFISLVIIVPGIIFWAVGGLKRSIEFSGGTQVEAVFQAPVSQDSVEKALVAGGYKDNLVQMAEGGKIAYASVKDRSADAYLSVEKALQAVGTPYQLQSHSLVGGVISAELTQNAFQAVILASLCIILYLAIAFGLAGGSGAMSLAGMAALNLGIRAAVVVGIIAAVFLGQLHGWHYTWQVLLLEVGGTAVGCGLLFTIGWLVAGFRFGISAIVALLHDVLVLIGSFAILGYFLNWQIDSMFIVATLTVVGFSVHDTIVIFDRLRENLRHRMRGELFEDLANRSILQSFARSINTSFTVILTLVAMMIWGEPSTRLLITALLIGIVSGTYSSIFNATPILVDWENWLAKLRGTGNTVAIMPVLAPGTSSTGGGGSARPVRSAKPITTTRPVAESPSDEGEEATPAGAPPAPRNRPKKRSSRRF
ncbi:MAG TPA: protein translocase subunit SecF, partial [Capsulimonadaceae bacterium]|nr:protein translocase subunit SecF [Capsulimonadaceae bacterium]